MHTPEFKNDYQEIPGSSFLKRVKEFPSRGVFYVFTVDNQVKVTMRFDMRTFSDIIRPSLKEEELSQIATEMMMIMAHEQQEETKAALGNFLRGIRDQIQLENNLHEALSIHEIVNRFHSLVLSTDVLLKVGEEIDRLTERVTNSTKGQLLKQLKSFNGAVLNTMVLQKIISLIIEGCEEPSFSIKFGSIEKPSKFSAASQKGAVKKLIS